jgi:zinc transport system permease protein
LLLAVLGTLAISYLQRKKIVYSEAAIGILFSFGLALGAVLVSLSGGFNVDLFAYLFGSILTVTTGDLILISVLTIAVLLFVIFFYKELLHLTFDEQGARLSGVPVVAFEIIFNLVVALAVVVSIKIIGSLLVSSLLIIPASSAMQLAHSFKKTVWGSLIIGTVSVICGLFVSFYYDVASGGAIVLISVGVFLLCVLFKKYIIVEVPDEGPSSSK